MTVTYNSEEVLDDFLVSLKSQSLSSWVLYVVDNDSKDRSIAKVKQFSGQNADCQIEIIANQQNVGVAAGNNQGIRRALESGCSHILLLNNDTVFGPYLISRLLETLDKYPCDMATPKIYYASDPKKIWFAGGRFIPWRGYVNVHIGANEIDQGQYDSIEFIDYAPTCCLLVKCSVFHQVGYMDEKYFVYYDDTDFCFRTNKAGIKLVYDPMVSMYHKVSSLTGGDETPFTIRSYARNRAYFVRKNLGWMLFLPWFIYYQIYMILKVLTCVDSLQTYRLRQQGLKQSFYI